MSERGYNQHADQCDCELVMDDGFASVATLQTHIELAIEEYDRLSIGMTDEMVSEALAAIWRDRAGKGGASC